MEKAAPSEACECAWHSSFPVHSGKFIIHQRLSERNSEMEQLSSLDGEVCSDSGGGILVPTPSTWHSRFRGGAEFGKSLLH